MSVKGKEKRRASKTVLTSAEIAEQWPLHWLVWEGKDKELERVLKEEEVRERARYSPALRRDTCTKPHGTRSYVSDLRNAYKPWHSLA